MSIYEKLTKVQFELKAPKGQYNSFGNYKYRSCEDILESVKPLLAKYKLTLIVSDNLELIGNRFYVKATARVYDIENGENIETTAYAREAEDKKGMDESQITGSTSSYARKYALNGLFAIDDTKDADVLNTSEEFTAKKKKTAPLNEKEAEKVFAVNLDEELDAEDIKWIDSLEPSLQAWFCTKKFNVDNMKKLTKSQIEDAKKIHQIILEKRAKEGNK